LFLSSLRRKKWGAGQRPAEFVFKKKGHTNGMKSIWWVVLEGNALQGLIF
jgi:hypothetical protein